MTVPTEFPATSLSCISMLPKRYSFLDWNPEPEALSRERVRSWPLLSILARPSPQVISKFWWKFPDASTTITEAKINRDRRIKQLWVNVMIDIWRCVYILVEFALVVVMKCWKDDCGWEVGMVFIDRCVEG